MSLRLSHWIGGALFLCIASVARPSNADGPVLFRWVAPDGTVFTVELAAPRAQLPPPAPITTVPTTSFEQEVLALTNARRAAGATCGTQAFAPAPPLAPNAALRDAAQKHSVDMGTRDYFDHTSLDGRSPGDRIHASGLRPRTWGENIFAGPRTPAEVVDGWMKSPGHCVNIMNPRFRFLGVGYASVPGSTYTNYWTQDFGG